MSWVNAVIAGIGTYFSNRSADKDKAADNEGAFTWGSRRYAFDKELDRYYDKIDKAEQRRGAAEYGKFSSLDRWAPNYTNTFQPDPIPTKPTTGTIKGTY